MDAFSEFCLTMSVIGRAREEGHRSGPPYNFWNGVTQGECAIHYKWKGALEPLLPRYPEILGAIEEVEEWHKERFRQNVKLRDGTLRFISGQTCLGVEPMSEEDQELLKVASPQGGGTLRAALKRILWREIHVWFGHPSKYMYWSDAWTHEFLVCGKCGDKMTHADFAV